MSEVLETIQVVREDHPDGYTEINKRDMSDDDVLYDPEKAEKDEPKEGTVAWLEMKLKEADVDIPEGALKADLEDLYAGLDADD